MIVDGRTRPISRSYSTARGQKRENLLTAISEVRCFIDWFETAALWRQRNSGRSISGIECLGQRGRFTLYWSRNYAVVRRKTWWKTCKGNLPGRKILPADQPHRGENSGLFDTPHYGVYAPTHRSDRLIAPKQHASLFHTHDQAASLSA